MGGNGTESHTQLQAIRKLSPPQGTPTSVRAFIGKIKNLAVNLPTMLQAEALRSACEQLVQLRIGAHLMGLAEVREAAIVYLKGESPHSLAAFCRAALDSLHRDELLLLLQTGNQKESTHTRATVSQSSSKHSNKNGHGHQSKSSGRPNPPQPSNRGEVQVPEGAKVHACDQSDLRPLDFSKVPLARRYAFVQAAPPTWAKTLPTTFTHKGNDMTLCFGCKLYHQKNTHESSKCKDAHKEEQSKFKASNPGAVRLRFSDGSFRE